MLGGDNIMFTIVYACDDPVRERIVYVSVLMPLSRLHHADNRNLDACC